MFKRALRSLNGKTTSIILTPESAIHSPGFECNDQNQSISDIDDNVTPSSDYDLYSEIDSEYSDYDIQQNERNMQRSLNKANILISEKVNEISLKDSKIKQLQEEISKSEYTWNSKFSALRDHLEIVKVDYETEILTMNESHQKLQSAIHEQFLSHQAKFEDMSNILSLKEEELINSTELLESLQNPETELNNEDGTTSNSSPINQHAKTIAALHNKYKQRIDAIKAHHKLELDNARQCANNNSESHSKSSESIDPKTQRYIHNCRKTYTELISTERKFFKILASILLKCVTNPKDVNISKIKKEINARFHKLDSNIAQKSNQSLASVDFNHINVDSMEGIKLDFFELVEKLTNQFKDVDNDYFDKESMLVKDDNQMDIKMKIAKLDVATFDLVSDNESDILFSDVTHVQSYNNYPTIPPRETSLHHMKYQINRHDNGMKQQTRQGQIKMCEYISNTFRFGRKPSSGNAN
jgi:hypothetical protein